MRHLQGLVAGLVTACMLPCAMAQAPQAPQAAQPSGTAPATQVAQTAQANQPPGPEVLTFRLALSNLHVIRGKRTVLIDAGSRHDMPRLEAELSRAGIGWADISALIVTHGHSDHTALAAEIRRRSGAPILLGRADAPMARAGRHDDLRPTNLTAAFIKQFMIDPTFEPFEPDVAVDEPIRLDRYGVSGRVYAMPGHTPGSLVVELDDGRSFVGDMVLGGYLGGALMPQRAGEHYFHADRGRNLDNIRTLLRGGARLFYLGHGGPVSRESVAAAFAQAENTPSPKAKP